MQPFFITVSGNLFLMVIPDSQAHLDGHVAITYTYSIYRDQAHGEPGQARAKQPSLHLEKNDDPDYMGYIVFELPGRIFNYVDQGQSRLNMNEVEEAIEQITHYRESPGMWTV